MTGRASGWEVVRARGARRCSRCGDTIPKGARYETWTWYSDDPPLRCSSHLLCGLFDIGVDDDGMLHESYGEAEWWDYAVWHCPAWTAGERVSPVALYEWLRSLPPIEWQL